MINLTMLLFCYPTGWPITPIRPCALLNVRSTPGSPANADNASSDEFLDLTADAGVLHVLVESLWIALGLL